MVSLASPFVQFAHGRFLPDVRTSTIPIGDFSSPLTAPAALASMRRRTSLSATEAEGYAHGLLHTGGKAVPSLIYPPLSAHGSSPFTTALSVVRLFWQQMRRATPGATLPQAHYKSGAYMLIIRTYIMGTNSRIFGSRQYKMCYFHPKPASCTAAPLQAQNCEFLAPTATGGPGLVSHPQPAVSRHPQQLAPSAPLCHGSPKLPPTQRLVVSDTRLQDTHIQL
ncbi:hypothetical protein B0H13DRAFT_2656919 [Mycena leptocephala]|nr:hypothetical protein B0H13DRAFT_2656919 [Mycena leptocephala]